jgi:hypothetical protein
LGRRDDFASEFEAAFARLQVLIEEACGLDAGWPQRVARAIRAALEFAASDPDAARLLTSEALARGQDGFARYDRLLAYLGELLLPGRAQRPEGERLPEITERAMAGGLASLIAQRVDQGSEAGLPGLAEEAIQFVLTPYLGAEEAQRVASADPV